MKRSLFKSGLLALMMAAGKMMAQELPTSPEATSPTPTSGISGAAPDTQSSNDFFNNLKISNFMMLDAAPATTPGANGKTGGVSIAPTDVVALEYQFSPTLIGTAAIRADSIDHRRGFSTSNEYVGIQSIDLIKTLKTGDAITIGTITWASLLANPDMDTGVKAAMLDNYFSWTRPNPVLAGALLRGVKQNDEVFIAYESVAGTGARVDEHLKGAAFHGLCEGHGNTEACGLVVGGKSALMLRRFPGLFMTSEAVHIQNGGNAHNEGRYGFGVGYSRYFGPVEIVQINERHVGANYLGGNKSLVVESSRSMAGGRFHSIDFSGYFAEISARGAINQHSRLVGVDVAKHGFSIEAYAGSQRGMIVRWETNLSSSIKRHHTP